MSEQENIAFNAAINFALDEAGGDGLIFLRMWREGDWAGIAKEFPEFDLETTGNIGAIIYQDMVKTVAPQFKDASESRFGQTD